MRVSLVPARSHDPELLDRPDNSFEELALALRDIARVNRWLGGTRAVRRPLEQLVARAGLTEFTLLDIGTGGGEIPRAIVASAARRGIAARAAGIDIDPNIARYAGSMRRGRGLRPPSPHAIPRVFGGEDPVSAPAGDPGRPPPIPAPLAVVRTDGFALPFPDAGFDFVTSSMMFHHFREDAAARLLVEMARVARHAVIVNDLGRHLVPWAAIWLLARFGESRMVRHDGPLSVLKGWTARELLELARAAGLDGRARVERYAPYRFVLVVETEGMGT